MKPTPAQLPPTGRALLDLLTANGGAIDYHDPRVTTSGLTALRHRGMARVVRPERVVLIVLTDAGRAVLATMETT